MPLLIAIYLVEFACLVTIAYDAPWWDFWVCAGVIMLQSAWNVWRFDSCQKERRCRFVYRHLNAGYSHEEALMAAAYTYPDVRLYYRLARDLFISLFERKG